MRENKKNPAVMGISIGDLLNQKIKEKRLTHAEIERKMGRTNGSIKRLIRNPSLQCYLLWELSLALNYNFFQHLADALFEKGGEKILSGNMSDKNTIANLEKENQRLTEERDYLKKMIDIMAMRKV